MGEGAGAVVRAQGLVVRYGRVEAVAGVDLAVDRGEVVGLIGPDGAGKTSTLRVLAGLDRACAGSVRVLGRDAWRERRALHHRLGYLAQRFALYGDLTVAENVQFFALLLGVPDWRSRRAELLERVDLARFADRLAERLSGGMKQKLALACALMHSPEVLVLDEPTAGVDPVTRRELWRLLGELVAEGLTLVVATPYLDEAERCSRVVLMHRGRVLADDRPAALAALLPGVVVEVAAAPRTRAGAVLARAPGVVAVQSFGARFPVRVGSEEAAAALRQDLVSSGLEVEELRVVRASLEDTFLHLVASGAPGAGEAA